MDLGVGSQQTRVLGPRHCPVLTSLDLPFFCKYQTVPSLQGFLQWQKRSASAMSNMVALWLVSS